MVGLTNPLQVGQTVTLQEKNWGYQVTLLPPGQPGLKVVDLGPEHVLFEDETAAGPDVHAVCAPGRRATPRVRAAFEAFATAFGAAAP